MEMRGLTSGDMQGLGDRVEKRMCEPGWHVVCYRKNGWVLKKYTTVISPVLSKSDLFIWIEGFLKAMAHKGGD